MINKLMETKCVDHQRPPCNENPLQGLLERNKYMKNNSEETSVPWVFKIKNYQFREMYMYDESALATLIISELKSLYSIDNFSKDQLITITSLHRSINLQ